MDSAPINIPTAGISPEEEEEEEEEDLELNATTPQPPQPQPQSPPPQSPQQEEVPPQPTDEQPESSPIQAPAVDADLVAAIQSLGADADIATATTVMASPLSACVSHANGKFTSVHVADTYAFDTFQQILRPLIQKLYGEDLYAQPPTVLSNSVLSSFWAPHAVSIQLCAFRNFHNSKLVYGDDEFNGIEAFVLHAAESVGTRIPVSQLPPSAIINLPPSNAKSAVLSEGTDTLTAVVPLVGDHVAVVVNRNDGNIAAALDQLTQMLSTLGNVLTYATHPNLGNLSANPDHLRAGLCASVSLKLPSLSPGAASSVVLPRGVHMTADTATHTFTFTQTFSSEPTLHAALAPLCAVLDSLEFLTPAPAVVAPPPPKPPTPTPTPSDMPARVATPPQQPRASSAKRVQSAKRPPTASEATATTTSPSTTTADAQQAPSVEVDSAAAAVVAEDVPLAAEPQSADVVSPNEIIPAEQEKQEDVQQEQQEQQEQQQEQEPAVVDAVEQPPTNVDEKQDEEKKIEKDDAAGDAGEAKADEIDNISDALNPLPYNEKGPITKGFDASLLQLVRSEGYSSNQAGNVAMLSADVIVFIAGNILQFTDLRTGAHTYRRSSGGNGIGAIAVHPSYTLYAVGELGPNPVINIFTFPEHNLVKVLKKGALNGYASLCFSSSGDKLASVATQPDYMLTVWDWRRQLIELRAKAFSSDVYRVTFNHSNDGQLTTAGAGHIRFWKMATTFTGLKLQGQIGRFGKTEMSDIAGYVEFPDGKVLSSTEWGGLLLWEGGLVKCELSRKGRKACHLGPVECIYLEEGEIITAGADGTIRLWDFEAIDVADRPSDGSPVELEPMLERKVGPNVHIKSMTRVPGSAGDHSMWLVQDARGALWRVDLSHAHTVTEPLRLLSYHAGEVHTAAMCPRAHAVFTGGADGSVRVMDYLRMQLLAPRTFNSAATAALWAPLAMDAGGRTVIVGFGDGVLRILSLSDNDGLVVVAVAKPHAQAITRIVVSPDASVLATVCADKSIFFLAVRGVSAIEPIGFIEVPDTINYLDWSPDGAHVLAACNDGCAYEYAVPTMGQFDTSSTYHLEALSFRKFQLSYAKPVEAPPEKKDDKNKDKTKGKGDGDKDKDGEEAEKKPPPPPPEPVKGPVLCAWYTPRSTIILSMGGTAAGYMFECDVGNPVPLTVFPMAADSTALVHAVASNTNGHYLLLGADDGTVRVHDISNMMRSYSIAMHGDAVLSVATSFDGSHSVSTGRDGNVFIYRTRLDGAELQDGAFGPLHNSPVVEDIVDSKAYSYEQAKQRAELDRRMRTAEDRKMDERRTVRALRKAFEAILKENATLPEDQQLTTAMLEMDPALHADIEEQTVARKERVTAEMAWELERSKVGHRKLRAHFLDGLSHTRVVVRGIRTHEQVSTFRCPMPSIEFKRRASIAKPTTAPSVSLLSAVRPSMRPSTVISEEMDMLEASMLNASEMGGGRSRMMAEALKAQQRKLRRKQRQAKWEALQASKPDEASADPDDVAAITDAELNMGDYKLKTAEDYVVPLAERVNTTRKRDQLVMLRQRMFDAKCTYNELVLLLRGRKEKTIEKLAGLRDELRGVLEDLGESLDSLPVIPTPHDDEYPERKYNFSRTTLDEFRDQESARNAAAAAAAAAAGDGGFGGFGGFGGAGGNAAPTSNAVSAGATASVVEGTGDGSGAAAGGAVAIDAIVIESDEITPLEAQMRISRHASLEHRRDELVAAIDNLISSFDKDLFELQQIQVDTELRIKSADYRHVLFYQELVHLRVFDKKEHQLEERRSSKVDELAQTKASYKMSSSKLNSTTKDLTRLQAQEKTVQTQFAGVIGENQKFEKILTKIYKKKVVRQKQRTGDESDDEDDDESEEFSEDGSDAGSSDDEEIDETVCPPGCDQAAYEKVMQLREMRADVEEQLAEVKKSLETLKKDLDSFTKKEKSTQMQLTNAEKDITAFQLEKQGRLNELNVAVPLRLHQIKNLVNGAFPKDLSDAVLFDVHNIEKLQNRIADLTEEKSMQRKEYKEIKQTQARMANDKGRKEEHLAVLQKKFEELQMLKFGMLIDLDTLAGRTINTAAEELKLKQVEIQKAQEQELLEIEEEISAAQSETTQLVRENTELLSAVASGEQQRRGLERSLNHTQRMVAMTTGKQTHTEDAIRKLEQAAQTNTREATVLRSEIHRLSRKGGHVVPPRASTNTNVDKLPPLQ